MSSISVHSTDEALSSNASFISLYVESRESLPTMPPAFYSELVTDTDSIVLHPPGYTITCANTPNEHSACEMHENTSAPHPHLLYDVQQTSTSYETPALC